MLRHGRNVFRKASTTVWQTCRKMFYYSVRMLAHTIRRAPRSTWTHRYTLYMYIRICTGIYINVHVYMCMINYNSLGCENSHTCTSHRPRCKNGSRPMQVHVHVYCISTHVHVHVTFQTLDTPKRNYNTINTAQIPK